MFNKILALSHGYILDSDLEYLDFNMTLVDYLYELGYDDRVASAIFDIHAFTIQGKIDVDDDLLIHVVTLNTKLVGNYLVNNDMIEENFNLTAEAILRLNDELYRNCFDETVIIIPLRCPYILLTKK